MSETESMPGCRTVEPVGKDVQESEDGGGVVPEAIGPPDTIGRYQIQSLLGEGGMGQVFAAFDPELGRTVALKLVRSDRLRSSGRDRARLLREAQALAKLQHPNVVAIYDAGAEGEQVFIAMELIVGRTLGQWLQSASRPWPAIVDRFVAAGRGLAAAHEVGIIHRDFKPSNVVVGAQRVVVVDFGLARPGGDTDQNDAGSSRTVFDVNLTLTGERIGTLRYMAPEQHLGGALSPQTDQFAFAVTLWEALYGISPFSGKNSAEILRAMRQGPALPLGHKVPERLRAALTRALAVEPGHRWPSLEGLIAALERSRAVRGRSLALAAVAVGLMGAAFVGGRQQATAPPCDAGAGLAADVWTPLARARIQTAFRATGSPYADETYRRIDATMQAKLDGWARAHRETCEATHVRHEQSETLLDLRMRCLGEARTEIENLVTALGDSSQDAVDHALRAVADTGDVSSCATVSLQSALAPPKDPRTATRVVALDAERARVQALYRLGRAKEAVAAGRELLERARALDYAPARAEILSVVHTIESAYGDAGRVPDLTREQLRFAQEAHDDRLVAMALTDEASFVGVEQRRFIEGARLFGIAEAALLRAGDVPAAASSLMQKEGNFLAAQNQPSFALSRYALALAALCSRGDCANHTRLPFVLQGIAGEEASLGETTRARVLMERALALLERTRRADDPLLAAVQSNLGTMEYNAGNFDAAISRYGRALSIAEAGLDPDHLSIALVLTNLSEALAGEGRYADARERAERALRIREPKLGRADPHLVPTLQSLAAIALGEGKLTEARTLADRSLAVGKAALGADSQELIGSYEVLAGVALARGLPAEARAAAERAFALNDKSADKLDAEQAKILRLKARALAAQRHVPDALATLARAQALDPALGNPEALLGDAEVLIAVGQPNKAIPLAERAGSAPGVKGALGERARQILGRALRGAGRDAHAPDREPRPG